MKTKRFKSWLHVWITFTSLLSFLGGWIVFSHTPKPAALSAGLVSTAAQSSTTLSPIPSLDSLLANTSSSQTTLQALTTYQLSSRASTSVLHTGGS
jgi:hypothetical protein